MLFLKRLAARNLDLDAPDFLESVPEVCLERGAARRLQWHVIRMVLRESLDSGSSAIHIFYDEEDDRFRMLHCVPQEGDAWFEIVPGPNVMMRQIIKRLMSRCGLGRSRSAGRLTYIYHGVLKTAECVSSEPGELLIYFTHQRPRTLNKKAGDKPGVPTLAR